MKNRELGNIGVKALAVFAVLLMITTPLFAIDISGERATSSSEGIDAEGVFVVDGIYYKILTDSTVEVTKSKTGFLGDYVIPSTVKYGEKTYDVKAIGDEAFRGMNLHSVILLSDGIERIGKYAFAETRIITVHMTNTVKIVDDYAFYNSPFMGVFYLSNNLSYIGDYAFFGTQIIQSKIPRSVTHIGNAAFANITNTTSIKIEDGNLNYKVVDDVIFDTNIETLVMYGKEKTEESYEVPATVKTIMDYAIQNNNLKNITITGSVSYISDYAFNKCEALENINVNNQYYESSNGILFDNGKKSLICVPIKNNCEQFEQEGLERIGDMAFYNCEKIKTITLGEQVSYIGVKSLTAQSVEKIIVNQSNPNYVSTQDGVLFDKKTGTLLYYPAAKEGDYVDDSTIEIGNYAFRNSKLNSVHMSNVKTVGAYAFEYSNITSVTMESASVIEEYAFVNSNSLSTVSIPNVETVGNFAFDQARLTSLVMNSVKHIGDYAFGTSKLTEINLEKAEWIGTFAFSGNNFSNVKIYGCTSYIGEGAFQKCPKLTSFETIENEYYVSVDGVLFSKDMKVLMFYPANKTDITHFEIPATVMRVGSGAFANNTTLVSVSFPDQITRIGYNAFNLCSNIEKVHLPEALIGIPCSLFTMNYQGGKLVDVNIPSNIKFIGNNAFRYCTKLTDFVLPDSVRFIGSYTLRDTGITDVVIPSNVEKICTLSFDSKITHIILESNSSLVCENNSFDRDKGFRDASGNIVDDWSKVATGYLYSNNGASAVKSSTIEIGESTSSDVIVTIYYSDLSVDIKGHGKMSDFVSLQPKTKEGLKWSAIKDYISSVDFKSTSTTDPLRICAHEFKGYLMKELSFTGSISFDFVAFEDCLAVQKMTFTDFSSERVEAYVFSHAGDDFIFRDHEGNQYTFDQDNVDWFNGKTFVKITDGDYITEGQMEITVKVSDSSYGTVRVIGDTAYYGDKITLVAEPKWGYSFVKWEETGSTDPVLTFTVTQNVTYTAIFVKNPDPVPEENANWWIIPWILIALLILMTIVGIAMRNRE